MVLRSLIILLVLMGAHASGCAHHRLPEVGEPAPVTVDYLSMSDDASDIRLRFTNNTEGQVCIASDIIDETSPSTITVQMIDRNRNFVNRMSIDLPPPPDLTPRVLEAGRSIEVQYSMEGFRFRRFVRLARAGYSVRFRFVYEQCSSGVRGEADSGWINAKR